MSYELILSLAFHFILFFSHLIHFRERAYKSNDNNEKNRVESLPECCGAFALQQVLDRR